MVIGILLNIKQQNSSIKSYHSKLISILEDLAFKRPTSQSSTYKTEVSDFAVDGNNETWSVAGSPDKITEVLAWWSVTLDRMYYVKSVVLAVNYMSPC